ncbi:hypothetical protein DY218_26535 [Streptomyces triticagri]|uniref:Uncharacterized protein n=1 Tax=Streptomyces triticagri TaxID=2293568 RepID=A0A372LZJ1_9ACTN|nr:hypothetical protein DY218_26535 [Streptomyces triticagri]
MGAAVVAALTAGTFTAAAAEGAAARTEGVSVTADGNAADERTQSTVISRDGRYAAFDTTATDLVPGDTNGVSDVFVRDLDSGELERISQDGRALSAPSLSADGRYVAMLSGEEDATYKANVQLYDRKSGTFERLDVDLPDEFAGQPARRSLSLSADGRYAVFEIDDAHVSGSAVFLRDRVKGTTERISHQYQGGDGERNSHRPTVSDDGRYVVYAQSFATGPRDGDTSDIWLLDRDSGKRTMIDRSQDGEETEKGATWPSISGDGSKVVFESWDTHLVPDDTDGVGNVFVHDIAEGKNERIHGTQGGPDQELTFHPAISADGRYLTYSSRIEEDGSEWGDESPAYLRDLSTGEDTLVTPDTTGGAAHGIVEAGGVSGDGKRIAFVSGDETLLPEDTNGGYDAFVRHLD